MHEIQCSVGAFVTGPVPTVSTTEAVSAAIKIMKESGHAAVIAVDEEGLCQGILTERDVLNRIAAEGINPCSQRVSGIMTRAPLTLNADDCITYAINHMGVRGFSNLPLLDETGRPIGLLGIKDVARHLSGVFADLEQPDTSMTDLPEWIDVGGG